jgi:hypothetical protein
MSFLLLVTYSHSLVHLLLPLFIFCSISFISLYAYIFVYAGESVSKVTDYGQENQGLIPSKGSHRVEADSATHSTRISGFQQFLPRGKACGA